MKKINIDKIYRKNDFMEFIQKFCNAKKFKIIKQEKDCNIMICKIDKEKCLISTDLFDALIEQEILLTKEK